MILQCTCKNQTQDKLYGKGYRVHNPCKGGSYGRCTNCGKEQSVKVQAPLPKKESN